MDISRRIRVIGTVVLAVGLLAAVVIYATAKLEEPLGILGVDVRTNRDTLDLEKMGGKSYVLMHDFSEWFAGLWHGRRLAGTIGVIAAGCFLGSRWLAGFLTHFHSAKEPKSENA